VVIFKPGGGCMNGSLAIAVSRAPMEFLLSNICLEEN